MHAVDTPLLNEFFFSTTTALGLTTVPLNFHRLSATPFTLSPVPKQFLACLMASWRMRNISGFSWRDSGSLPVWLIGFCESGMIQATKKLESCQRKHFISMMHGQITWPTFSNCDRPRRTRLEVEWSTQPTSDQVNYSTASRCSFRV